MDLRQPDRTAGTTRHQKCPIERIVAQEFPCEAGSQPICRTDQSKHELLKPRSISLIYW